MNRLLEIARSGTPGTGVQFCAGAYGADGVRYFLRDVLAMANAAIDGNRYIVTGVWFDQENQRQVSPVDIEDFSSESFYQSLVTEFIEPPIPIKYRAVILEGRRAGVYEIGDCQDKPYMMRIDYSEHLRRGDAYMRVGDTTIKIGRRILFSMFENREKTAAPENSVEIGFPGEIIQKSLSLPTVDMNQLPSAVAHAKLNQLIDVREKVKDSGATTTMARMVHTRLFGSDDPYEDRSPTTLIAEMEQIRQKHEADDHHFLFEENAQRLQLVVFNQGDTPIRNASLTLFVPTHDAFYFATSLASVGDTVGFADYPTVSVRGRKATVSSTLGELPAGAQINAFELPLRFCAGAEMNDLQMTMRYKLYGSNLPQPIEGSLSLVFYGAESIRRKFSSGS